MAEGAGAKPLRAALGRILGVLTAVGCAYVLFVTVGIARSDIAMREALAPGLTEQVFVREVGQIYSVSPDGQSSPKFVCSFALSDDGALPIERVYFNRLGKFMPGELSAEITFRGRMTEFGDANMTGFEQGCDPCDLVHEVNARRSLCLSEKLLEESSDNGSSAPIAARFRRDAIIIERALFDHCGHEFSPAAETQSASCPVQMSAPWTAGLRKFLGVIDHRPL